MRTLNFSEFYAQLLGAAYGSGEYKHMTPNDNILKLTGHPPITFVQWLTNNLHFFA